MLEEYPDILTAEETCSENWTQRALRFAAQWEIERLPEWKSLEDSQTSHCRIYFDAVSVEVKIALGKSLPRAVLKIKPVYPASPAYMLRLGLYSSHPSNSNEINSPFGRLLTWRFHPHRRKTAPV